MNIAKQANIITVYKQHKFQEYMKITVNIV